MRGICCSTSSNRKGWRRGDGTGTQANVGHTTIRSDDQRNVLQHWTVGQSESMLVAPAEGAIMAAPEGATLPMVDGSEWGTKGAGESFLNILLEDRKSTRLNSSHS